MAKIGRNEPCPCGSGKKYKKCCLAREEARLVAEAQRSKAAPPTIVLDDDIDRLSNSVVSLLREGRFDEALVVCDRLQREYPEMIDGLMRSAMVHEARGDWALAADFYRRALAFTEQADQRDFFDEGMRDDFRKKIAQAETHAAAR